MLDFIAQLPWAHLALKLLVGMAAIEAALWLTRRMDKRAGKRESFAVTLREIAEARNPGLGIYYGLRVLGVFVFAAGAMYIT